MIIFCIPYAGGSSTFFNKFKNQVELQNNCEVILYDYPGHGRRICEPLVDDFQSLLKDVQSFFMTMVDKTDEVALFGYSMGALVAYELCCIISKAYKLNHLFIAAMEPPEYIQGKKKDFSMSSRGILSASWNDMGHLILILLLIVGLRHYF